MKMTPEETLTDVEKSLIGVPPKHKEKVLESIGATLARICLKSNKDGTYVRPHQVPNITEHERKIVRRAYFKEKRNGL